MARAAPVFLDRDGTLIVEKHFIRDPKDVRLETGVAEGLAVLRDHGHAFVVLSNQSGVGRGLLTLDDAQRVNAATAALLSARGIDIVAWYICPHEPDAGCPCRKPGPGMAHAAAEEWGLELAGSYVIGDKRSDLQLADAIGATGILVTTGYGSAAAEWALSGSRPVFAGLPGAAAYIVSRGGLS